MRRQFALAGLVIAFTACGAHAADNMVEFPGGPFTMGDDAGLADERSAHRVVLGAFAMDRLPVTNAQFARFLGRAGVADAQGRTYYDLDDNDARIHPRGDGFTVSEGYGAHPVVEPGWWGAGAYCGERGARLPNEAEWERAARGTGARTYPWGNQAPDQRRARFAAGWNQTSIAGSLKAGATPGGIFDMAGNVHELTSSLYRPYPYVAGDGVSRSPRAAHHNIGFRCAKTLH